MKKLLSILLCAAIAAAFTGCEAAAKDIDLSQLEPGDEVSIVGQKANSTLQNGNSITVQVMRPGERTLAYNCQLKDEYLSEAENMKSLSVVKVRGSYLSTMDLEQENTAILVTLYDCEILE